VGLSILAATASAAPLQSNSQAFIENKGQWDAEAQFLAQSGGLNLWVTGNGAVMDFQKVVPDSSKAKRHIAGHVIRVGFVDSAPAATAGFTALPGTYNYFQGADLSSWVSNVRAFSETRSEGLYKGISARYYFSEGTPRYDLIVQPGADPSKIAMQYEGADGVQVLTNGNLQIKTSLGTVEQRGLLAYQASSTGNKQVECRMVASGDTVRFSLGTYDKSKTLVIDPLIFSTYLGEANTDALTANTGVGVVSDSAGNAISVGNTNCPTFPTTVGAYQTVFGGGGVIYVTKLSADGTHLIYSTYLGADSGPTVAAVTLDSQGDPVILGSTYYSGYPVTAGAYQSTKQGLPNMVVTKLNSTGTALIFSTYFGGGGSDTPSKLALDSSGNVVIVGYGEDNGWPVTKGAFQTAVNDDQYDGLIAKLSADGKTVLWASYLGGVAYSAGDQALDVILDSANNLVIGGTAWSPDFPVTAGAYQTSNGGLADAYVVKMSADGSKEIFGTFLGGDTGAFGAAVGLTATGDPVIVGTTTRSTFPVTAGAFQTTFGGDGSSFVSVFSADGSTLLASTIFSGSVSESVTSVKVDKSGNIVFAGAGISTDMPVTANAFQSISGGNSEGFVAKLTPDCKNLLYSTYFGGSAFNAISSLALDPSGNAMITGYTQSTDFPLSANAFQTINYADVANLLSATSFVSNISMGSSGTTQSVTLALSPSTVTGGVTSYGTVTLSPAAPTGGATVSITSGASTLGTLPMTAGTTQGTFSLTTVPVDATVVFPITVSFNGGSQTQNLTVLAPALTTLTLGATTATAGTPVTGTVTLSGGARPSGVSISLSSSNTAAATVGASVPIASGAKTATFTVTPKAVATNTAVTITASFGGVSKTASLTVLAGASALSSIQLSPSTAAAGYSVIASVYLTSGAPAGGTVVSLKSSNTAVATVASTVTVAANTTSIGFYVNTLPVAVNTAVTITATAGAVSKTAVLTVTPATVDSIKLNVTSITGGTKVGGAAYLSGKAGTSPITISLKSSNTALATVPASIVVAANAPGQYLTVTTAAVTVQSSVTITATTGAASKSATLTITPSLSSLHLNVPTVTGGTKVGGAAYLTGHVGTIPVVIALKSSNSAVATVPASVTATTGELGQYLTVTTVPVSVDTAVTITASTGSISNTATLTVQSACVSAVAMPASVAGGKTFTLTITLAGAAGPSGNLVSLGSNSKLVVVPASVTIPAGAVSKVFTFTALTPTVSTPVTITATTGTTSKSATITVT
jgi:hypothetical protein